MTKRKVGYHNMVCEILTENRRNIVTFKTVSGRRLGQLVGTNLWFQFTEGLMWQYRDDMIRFCREQMKVEVKNV